MNLMERIRNYCFIRKDNVRFTKILRDEDLDEDAISDYITEHLEGNKTAY